MSSNEPTIAVVVSTYNGERFIAQQLDSILNQDVPNLSVFVRDDGSRDGTVAILEQYVSEGRITLFDEGNLGVVGSFLDVIARVCDDYDYVALSDQDDVWHPGKLSRALQLLREKDQSLPQLYCAEYTYCDEDMNPTGRSHLNQIGVDFQMMLYENMVSGNTCVMNRTLAQMITRAGREGVYCHDWWFGLLATALGELTFDDFDSLDYRRLSSSVSPSGTGGLTLLRYRLKTFFGKGEFAKITDQLQRLYDVYGDDLPQDKRALLERFLKGGRLRKATFTGRLRQKKQDEIALRVLFMAGML